MITAHPYRAVGTLLAVMAGSLLLSAMIGQFNDGPWGGLPSWLGATAWFTFLGTSLLLVLLSAYLAAASLRHRRAVR